MLFILLLNNKENIIKLFLSLTRQAVHALVSQTGLIFDCLPCMSQPDKSITSNVHILIHIDITQNNLLYKYCSQVLLLSSYWERKTFLQANKVSNVNKVSKGPFCVKESSQKQLCSLTLGSMLIRRGELVEKFG